MRNGSSGLSRTQRRTASRQGGLTLLLLVVVAAASFLGGVVVGRWSAPPVAELPPSTTSPRIAVVRPAVEVAPVSTLPASTADVPALPVVPTATAAAGSPPSPLGSGQGEGLTYYDTLTKGEPPPLGSGINLPPVGAAPAVTPPPAPAVSGVIPVAGNAPAPKAGVAAPPAAVPVAAASKPAGTSKPTVAAKTVAGTKPAVSGKPVAGKGGAAATRYIVQAAAFRKPEDAANLARRLSAKHYPTMVGAVEVPGKGIWHRLSVGPYATLEAANQAAKRLKSVEHLTPVVKKR